MQSSCTCFCCLGF